MPDLKYTIVTTATGTGIKQTTEDLKQLTEATKAAKDTTVKMADGGRRATDESAGLSKELQGQVAASKLTTAATKDQETSISSLARGFRSLGREIPIVGVAMRALLNPWTFLAALIGVFVVKIKEAISVQNELAKQSATLSARLDPLIVRQVRTKQLMEESKVAAEKFNERLQDQVGVLDDVNARLNASNEALDKRKRLEDGLADAEKQLALAQAGDDPEKRLKVEQQFRESARQREGLIAAGKIGAAHQALREAEARGVEAQAALPGARAALVAAQEAAGGSADDVAEALKLDAEEGERLQKELAEAELGAKGPFAMPGIGETAQQRVERARAAIESHRKSRDELLAKQKRIEEATRPQRRRVEQLERQGAESKSAVPGLQGAFRGLVEREEGERELFKKREPLIRAAEQIELTEKLAELLAKSNKLLERMADEQERSNKSIEARLKSNANKSN